MSAPTVTPPSAASAVNPLKELGKYGQSVWLDFIRRSLISSGELKHIMGLARGLAERLDHVERDD